AAADAVGALAFARGQDIHFAHDQYAPGTPAGDRLLAHEIAHTVQQTPGAAPQHQSVISAPGEPLEREADAAAAAVLAGEPFAVSAGAAPGAPVQRTPRPTTARDNGMITRELTATLTPGGRRRLHVGTYVEVVSRDGDNLNVRVHSGYNGAETQIPADAFRSETQIGDERSATADTPDQRVMYREFRGPLWADGGPVLADIDQGSIGDCYLLAAMGTVVRANPRRIQNMISPHTPDLPAYQVTLYQFNATGQGMHPRTISVDADFPVMRDSSHRATEDLMYGGEGAASRGGRGGAPATVPVLWPLLVEKAYAQMGGGYQNIDNTQSRLRGRSGQSTDDALERLLGTRAEVNHDADLAREARALSDLTDMGMTPAQLASASNPLALPDGQLARHLQGYLDRHIGVELGTPDRPVSSGGAPDEQRLDPANRELSALIIRHQYVLDRVDVSGGRIHVFNPHGAGGQLPRGLTEAEVRRYFNDITTSGQPVADRGR
ncbi:MAG: DUF4157 domain-containing protein, partial [Deltaproteobacteria bacterium]|nr:DUF4157 domain-containing protein [Kofleriaceae bacterium]